MAGDTANPRVWVNADVYTGPLGSTGPTNTASDLDAAFLALGLLSEDGFTEARSDTTDDKYAYGSILVRTVRSKHKRTMKVTALEDNPVVFGLVNPGSTAVTDTGVTTRTVVVPEPNRVAFVLHLEDGDITKRIWIPQGEILEVGDAVISDSEIVTRELTITIYPNADKVLYYEITDDPQAEE